MIQNRIISSNNFTEMDSVMSTGLSLDSRSRKLETCQNSLHKHLQNSICMLASMHVDVRIATQADDRFFYEMPWLELNRDLPASVF